MAKMGMRASRGVVTGVGQLSLCSSCRNTLFIGRNLKVGGMCGDLEIARWLFSSSSESGGGFFLLSDTSNEMLKSLVCNGSEFASHLCTPP